MTQPLLLPKIFQNILMFFFLKESSAEVIYGNNIHHHHNHHTKNEQIPLRIAFCITGQLARLEIISKIDNILLPNAVSGNNAHLYVYLDNEVTKVKQTFWKYDYTEGLYNHYNSLALFNFIDNHISQTISGIKFNKNANGTSNSTVLDALRERVKTFVHMAPPSNSNLHVVGNHVMVHEKKNPGSKKNFESAESRFQNNLRWMNGLRDCVKYMQKQEYLQGWHYDIVVRMRDDSYFLDPWVITNSYRGKLTALRYGAYHGINDHHLSIDRRFADTLFRGLIEDYYTNKTLKKVFWGNAEHRILLVVNAYHIPVKRVSVCEQSMIPLRGLVDKNNWRLHPFYIQLLMADCKKIRTVREEMEKENKKQKSKTHRALAHKSSSLSSHGHDNSGVIMLAEKLDLAFEDFLSYPTTCCDDRWMKLLHSGTVKTNPQIKLV